MLKIPFYFFQVTFIFKAEIVELADNAARDNRKARISPRHLMLAVKTDEELAQLFKKCILPESGVVPNIPYALVSTKKDNIPSNPTATATVPSPKKLKKTPAKRVVFPKITDDEEKIDAKKSKNITLLNERTLASGQKVRVKKKFYKIYILFI